MKSNHFISDPSIDKTQSPPEQEILFESDENILRWANSDDTFILGEEFEFHFNVDQIFAHNKSDWFGQFCL